MGLLTANGETAVMLGSEGAILLDGDIGGGTFNVYRLKEAGVESNASAWVLIDNGTDALTYTAVPAGNTFDVGGQTKIKGILTGSTTPSLEYHLRVR